MTSSTVTPARLEEIAMLLHGSGFKHAALEIRQLAIDLAGRSEIEEATARAEVQEVDPANPVIGPPRAALTINILPEDLRSRENARARVKDGDPYVKKVLNEVLDPRRVLLNLPTDVRYTPAAVETFVTRIGYRYGVELMLSGGSPALKREFAHQAMLAKPHGKPTISVTSNDR